MDTSMFLTLLFAFSLVSSLVTEGAKQLKKDFSSSLLALIISLVVGCGGTFVYYSLASISIGSMEILFAILLGLASGLCSTCGYDKVKQTIIEIIESKKDE